MKAKWGSLVVDGRGKIGGHVASKNRSGSYIRTKTSPVNPQSSAQTAVRTSFTAISQAWRSLSQAARDAWNGAVDKFKGTDVFGDVKTPTGANVYMRLNQNLALAGAAGITVPPANMTAPEGSPITATCDISDTALEVTSSVGAVPANTVRVYEATPPVSAGVEFVKNKFAVVGNRPAAAIALQDIWADYVAKYGVPPVGSKIFVRSKDVSTVSGLTSGYNSTYTIVVA